MVYIKRVLYLTLLFFISLNALFSQGPSRSGYPATYQDFRLFPCAGDLLFEERFSGSSVPAGWTTLDLDGLTPVADIAGPPVNALPGWQSREDFLDKNNRLMISPSWYTDSTQSSNDWLISPKISLGSNTCLSWYAYSQDKFFPESYEVRISTGTPTVDQAGFMAEPILLEVGAEVNELTYRSVNLAAYAGQDVYIAFRHTSKDKFVLALDDIRLSEVKTQDISPAYIVEPIVGVGEDVIIEGAVLNVGSDTLKADSILQIHYSIDGGNPQTMIILDSVLLAPNDTMQFKHDSIWIPNIERVYRLCVWVSGVPDVNMANDTVCQFVGIGRFVGIEDEVDETVWEVYPNPVKNVLTVGVHNKEMRGLRFSLRDIHGKEVIASRQLNGNNKTELTLEHLPTGIYILHLMYKSALIGSRKIIKQ